MIGFQHQSEEREREVGVFVFTMHSREQKRGSERSEVIFVMFWIFVDFVSDVSTFRGRTIWPVVHRVESMLKNPSLEAEGRSPFGKGFAILIVFLRLAKSHDY